jgi:hypothetical protein
MATNFTRNQFTGDQFTDDQSTGDQLLATNSPDTNFLNFNKLFRHMLYYALTNILTSFTDKTIIVLQNLIYSNLLGSA